MLKMEKIKYISLFSGIGGFEVGIQNSKYKNILECIGFSEVDKYATSIYKKHFPEHRELGDATKIRTKELPEFELLVGGFPCQAFSIAGKKGGFDDTRGALFFEIARILKDKKPKYFLLENVRGLLSNDKGRTFQRILEVLSDIGYICEWQIYNSKNYGVPQNRERIYIRGGLRDQCSEKILCKPTQNKLYKNEIKVIGNCAKGGFESSNIFSNNGCCRCLLATDSKHPIWIFDHGNLRKLTPIEHERLQGLPDNWTAKGIMNGSEVNISDTQRYRLCGNAVTTNVVSHILNNWDL